MDVISCLLHFIESLVALCLRGCKLSVGVGLRQPVTRRQVALMAGLTFPILHMHIQQLSSKDRLHHEFLHSFLELGN